MTQRIDGNGRLSKAVVAGGFVFLAGLTTRDKSKDITGQTADVLDQIDSYLARAGASKSDLVHVNIWLNNIADFEKVNAIWDAWVDHGNAPARATVESRLAGTGNLVEMTGKAFIGSNSGR